MLHKNDWIRTADLWNRKQLLCQLSPNHCRAFFSGSAENRWTTIYTTRASGLTSVQRRTGRSRAGRTRAATTWRCQFAKLPNAGRRTKTRPTSWARRTSWTSRTCQVIRIILLTQNNLEGVKILFSNFQQTVEIFGTNWRLQGRYCSNIF